MATYDSITDVMVRLRRLPEKVAERAVEIMKEEVPLGPGIGGHLRDTIKAEKMADDTYTVSTNKYPSTNGGNGAYYGIREVGAIIRAGRPGLVPKHESRNPHRPPALRWEDPFTGAEVYRYSVGPASPNDFVERTIKRLNAEIDAKGLGMAD